MRLTVAAIVLVSVFSASPAMAQAQTSPRLSPADETAAFCTAGFKKVGRQWQACAEGSTSDSYTPGTVNQVRDINGDGLPDAVIT